jgi:hypothetical protein
MKNILSIAILMLVAVPAFSSDITINIQPNYEFQIVSSSVLRDYYDRDVVLNFGATALVQHNKLNMGLFAQYVRYDFDVVDEMAMSGREEISGSRLTVGLQKGIRLKKNMLYGRLGLTKYYDDLAFALYDDHRIGVHAGLGFMFRLSDDFQAFVETSYEYEELSVPMYMTYTYTRHQMYLAGHTFDTGGLFFQVGLSLSIIR